MRQRECVCGRERAILGLCVLQSADLLPPGHCQIPQIHQQPAEDAAADSNFSIIYHPFVLSTCSF